MQPTMDRRTVTGIALGFGVVVFVALAVGIGYLLGSNDEDAASTTTLPPATVAPVPTSASTTTTTSGPRDFPELFEELRGAVANIDVAGCEFGSQGTAFLVGDDLAYTAWHVVEGATQIVLNIAGTSISAQIIGHDPDRDIAVLRLESAVVDARPLVVSSTIPRVGEEVAAMGHPRGLPLALTVGRVTSMNGEFDFGGDEADLIDNLIQTDAVVAPGSSGGPLINDDGEVIGIVVLLDLGAEGLMYASDIQSMTADLARWADSPEPVTPTTCFGSVDINNVDLSIIASDIGHPDVPDIQRTYAVYVHAINSGRAVDAFQLLGPTLQRGSTPESWAEGQSTSWLWDWRIRDVVEIDPNTLDVTVTFESTQAPEFGPVLGQTCSKWRLTHRLVRGEVDGLTFWLIDGSSRAADFPIDCEDWVAPLGNTYSLTIQNPGDEDLFIGELLAGTYDNWTVDLQVGDSLVTRLDSDAFDALIVIRDPAGVEVARNDDRGDGSLNSEAFYEVLTAGRYAVEIHHLVDTAGGQYVLEATLAVG